MKQFNEISTPELVELLQNKNVKVIDVRPVDAYNGWKIKKEKRGGHIRGAKSLPVKWTNYIDWIEIVRSKQIAPNNKIVIYAYSEIESKKVANLFVKAELYRCFNL